jgi:hypothetical protein
MAKMIFSCIGLSDCCLFLIALLQTVSFLSSCEISFFIAVLRTRVLKINFIQLVLISMHTQHNSTPRDDNI